MTDENIKIQEGATTPEEVRIQPETTPLIEGANSAAERIEIATAKLKAENDRTEILFARRALGGRAEAGEIVGKEETPREYRDRILRESRGL